MNEEIYQAPVSTETRRSKTIICHPDHPDTFLTHQQLTLLKERLKEKLKSVEIWDGQLAFFWTDDITQKWVSEQIGGLKCRQEKEYVFKMTLTDVPVSTKAYLNKLKAQNPKLNISDWVVTHKELNAFGRKVIYVEMSLKNKNELAKTGNKVQLGMGTVFLEEVSEFSYKEPKPIIWRMIICPEKQPDEVFTYDEMEVIKKELRQSMVKVTDRRIKIEETKLRFGDVLVVCSDENSKIWLETQNKQLGDVLGKPPVLIREELPYKYKVKFEDFDDFSSKEFLRRIKLQNPFLYISDWIVFHMKNKNGKREIYIEMTVKGFTSLREHDCLVNYGLDIYLFESPENSLYKEGIKLVKGYPCDLVIYHEDFPMKKISREEAIDLKQFLVGQLTKQDNINKTPTFTGFHYDKGYIYIKVDNNTGDEWLYKRIKEYRKNVLNKIEIQKARKNIIEIVLDNGGLSKPSSLLTLIKNQNKSLNVSYWRIIGMRVLSAGIAGKVALLVEIDQNSKKQLGNIISAGLGKAEVFHINTDEAIKSKKKEYNL